MKEVQVNFAAEAFGPVISESHCMYTTVEAYPVGSEPKKAPVVVHTTPLMYVPLCVESEGPYKCLVDSGSELVIAKRVIVDELSTPTSSAGQIHLQGIFGVSVTADLVTLHVSVQDGACCPDDFCMSAVPIVFAVTDAMVQNCDFILPFDTVRKLQMGTGCDSAVSNAVVTRSHSKQQSTSSDQQPGDMSGTVNPAVRMGVISILLGRLI